MNIEIVDLNDNIPIFGADNVTMILSMDEIHSGARTRDLGSVFVTDLDSVSTTEIRHDFVANITYFLNTLL